LNEGKRFLIIGFCNFIFTYIVYVLVNLIVAYTIAFTVSFASGILFSAFLNSRYSFSTKLTVRRMTIFTFVCLINYFIGLAILQLYVEFFGIHEVIAPMLVIVVMVPISFVGTRLALVGSLTKGDEIAVDEGEPSPPDDVSFGAKG